MKNKPFITSATASLDGDESCVSIEVFIPDINGRSYRVYFLTDSDYSEEQAEAIANAIRSGGSK